MDRRGRTLVLRSFALATILSFACSEQGFSTSPLPNPPAGTPARPPLPPEPPPPSLLSSNLIGWGNSLTWIMNPVFTTGLDAAGFNTKVSSIYFQSTVLTKPGAAAVKQLLAAGQANNQTAQPVTLAKGLLGYINIMLKGGTPSNNNQVIVAEFGTWAYIVATANKEGVTPFDLLASWALGELQTIWLGLHPGQNDSNPYLPVAAIQSASGTALAFANEPTAGFPDDTTLAYASIFAAPRAPIPVPFQQRWTAWESTYGGYNTTNGDPGAGALTARLFGSVVGLDYHFTPETLLGYLIGGAGTNWSQGQSSGRSDALQFGVRGETHYGAAYFSGLLFATANWFNTNRFAAGDEVTAHLNAQSYSGRLETGYRYPVGLIGVSPYASAQVQYVHTPSYAETDLSGGGMGVNYNAMDTTDTRSELGARFDTIQVINTTMPLKLTARLAWAHDWLSNPSTTAAFQVAPGSNFILTSTAQPSDSLLTGLEAEMRLTPKWSIAAKFDGQFAGSSQTYIGSGKLRYAW
jgi:outer membrane autotransporter protein